MTKIRSRDARMIRDRRGRAPVGGGPRLPGGLGGRGGGPGGGVPFPMKAGGGVLGLLVTLAVVFLPQLLGGAIPSSAPGGVGAASDVSTGGDDDPCSSELEQILCGATVDVQEYWIDELPASFGVDYEVTATVFFSGSTSTGCGQATARTGPFYCPLDDLVYFDLDFLAQLQRQFGATGDLAAQYIVAHEYGHHVQNVLGIDAEVRRAQQNDPARANQYSVALELQADCLAGAWVRDAADRGLLDSASEVTEALGAAAAVGDDRIQQQTQGRVDPESWTHGSSDQRVTWFRRGFDTGEPASCDTFSEVL